MGLVIAGTSLGNPYDIPPRSLEALRTADLVVFEEDRPARGFLKAAGIHRDYLKFNEHAPTHTLDEVKRVLQQGGTVCYMSDQGMPNLSDPGNSLVAVAVRQGIKVQVIPGPCSLTAALAGCPFDCSRFFSAGFLPRETKDRLQQLFQLRNRPEPIVLLETPYRRHRLMEDLAKVYELDRPIVTAFDISGPAETFVYSTAGTIIQDLQALPPKRPFVVVVGPPRDAGEKV